MDVVEPPQMSNICQTFFDHSKIVNDMDALREEVIVAGGRQAADMEDLRNGLAKAESTMIADSPDSLLASLVHSVRVNNEVFASALDAIADITAHVTALTAAQETPPKRFSTPATHESPTPARPSEKFEGG